jgi:hypothetical protein
MEIEEDRRQAQRPVRRIPCRHPAQVLQRIAEDLQALADALPELRDPPVEESAHDQRDGEDEPSDHERLRGVLEDPQPVDRREVGQHVAAGEHSGPQRPDQDGGRSDEIEDPVSEHRGGEGGVGRAVDAVLDDVEAQEVAAAAGQQGIRSDAGTVAAEDGAPRDFLVGIRSRDHVAPRTRSADDSAEMAEDAETEPAPVDRGEGVEERFRCIENVAHGGILPT